MTTRGTDIAERGRGVTWVALLLALVPLARGADAAVVIQHALLAVEEDLVRLSDLAEPLLVPRVLVRMA